MKKGIIAIAIVAVVATMVSCGNKTKTASRLSETNGGNDSTLLADSVEGIAPDEKWTEAAVEAQVRKMYDRLNEMDNAGIINIRQLEDEFCTRYYLGLRDSIGRALENVKGDDTFFGDEEGYRFLVGLGTPLEIDVMKTDLLTGNMAQTQVRFKGADDENGFMRLELDWEDDQWRVKNFDQPEVFGPGGYLKMMEDFAKEHGINYYGE